MGKFSLDPPLLPKGGRNGWIPYLWLVYSIPFLMSPAYQGGGRWRWAAVLTGYAVFLVAYFRSYWERGRRLLVPTAVLCLLGCVLAPLTTTALVFFIYAVACCAEVDEPQRIWPYMLGIMAAEGVVVAVLRPHLMAWLPMAVFTPIVGLMVMHFAQRTRLTERLLVTQEELRRMAQIAERERIARDLHDLLGHTLSVIVLKSELASRLAETDAARAAAEIRDVEKISREALREVRAAVQGYRASGLAAEVEAARKALAAAGVRLEDEMAAVALPAAQEGVLALAIREGCTNVLRHAQATVCRVALRQRADGCELEIRDDGRGGGGSEGSGLRGMRERVELIGGSLKREWVEGTRLVVWVPLERGGEA